LNEEPAGFNGFRLRFRGWFFHYLFSENKGPCLVTGKSDSAKQQFFSGFFSEPAAGGIKNFPHPDERLSVPFQHYHKLPGHEAFFPGFIRKILGKARCYAEAAFPVPVRNRFFFQKSCGKCGIGDEQHLPCLCFFDHFRHHQVVDPGGGIIGPPVRWGPPAIVAAEIISPRPAEKDQEAVFGSANGKDFFQFLFDCIPARLFI